jgi:PKD repeat protein
MTIARAARRCLAALLATLAAAPAAAVSLTVTSTAGDGSLAAILAKLNEACPGGETRISFNIPAKTDPGCDAATGICRLDASADPVVRCSGVVIDGYTQPGASPNTSSGPGTDAALRIELAKPGVSTHTAAKAVTPGTFLVQGPPTAGGFAEITGVTVRGIAFPFHRLVLAPGESGGKLLGGGGHVIAGNAFGLHADGTPSGTFAGGVTLTGNPMTGVRIGGPAPADRNRFAGACCGADAIDAWGAVGALVEGNLVNLDAKGEPIAGSGVARGISIDGNPAAGVPDSRGNVVRRNVVANTLETPVHTGAGGANTVSETLVFGQPVGVPGHDFVSPAAGGRNAQQPPVVTGVLAGPDAVRVAGKATGSPGGTARIEFFHNDSPDANGDGRAQDFAGAVDVKLDAAGSGPFAATLAPSVRNLAATATDAGTGDTSRFADPRTFPTLAVDTLALAFVPQPAGTTSPAQAVTISNTGALAVSLAPAMPAGPFTADASACPATLAPGGACEVAVRFAPASVGTLSGELVVNNGAGIPVVVSLTGSGAADTTAPTAVIAAPATGRIGVAVALDASASTDVGGRIVRYTWTAVERPAGSTAFASPVVTQAPAFAFTPDKLGRYTVQLVATDDSGNQSAPASATIVVADADAPIAVLDAAERGVAGQPLALSGARSTDSGGGRIVEYTWTAIERPAGATAFASPVVTRDPAFTFTPDKGGTWRLQLVVTDDSGNQGAPAIAVVNVIAPDDTAPTAVIAAPATGRIGVAVALDASASTDIGGRIVRYTWTAVERPAGSTAFASPVVTQAPSFAFTPDKLGRYTVQLVATDDSGNQSAPASAIIVVADTDAPTAVLDAPAQGVTGQPIALSGSRSTDSGGGRIVEYTWTAIERPAGATAFASPVVTRDPAFTFTPDKGGTWRLQLVVTDDSGNQGAPAIAVVNVIAPDDTAPTAVIAAPATGRIGVAVALDASASTDIGGRIVRYTWTAVERPAGSTAFASPVVTQAPSFAFTPDKLGRYTVQLVATDDSGNQSAPASAIIVVADTDAPTAVLGAPAQGVTGQPIALSGSRSTDSGGGRIVEYTWTAIERPAGATAFASPVVTRDPAFTFTPDKGGTWRLQLVAMDDSGNASSPALAQVTVITPDTTPPTAVITAPATGRLGVAVALDASASTDVGGRIVRYTWTAIERPAGSTAFASPVVTQAPAFAFTPDKLGRYTVQLVATDDSGNQSAPASAIIVVADTDAPTAVLDAAERGVAGQPLALSGARSTDSGGGRIVEYTWTAIERPAGATAFASPVVTRDPAFTFTPDKGGTWRLQLVATDDSGNASAPALALVTVITPDTTPPTAAIAAPATGRIGVAVALDGSASSDVGGRVVRYAWSPVSMPAGSTAFPSPVVTMTPALSFTPDRLGRYTVQLVVTDDSGNQSAPASAAIVVADTDAPTAVLDAPAQGVAGQPIALSGSRSTDSGGGRIVQYAWSAIERPAGSTAFASPVVTPNASFTFTPDKGGTWLLQLVAMDDSGNASAPALSQVTVITPDTTPPTAVIAAPAMGRLGVAIALDASASSDVGGRIVRYAWTAIERPAGSTAFASPVVTPDPGFSFTPDRAGTWRVQLVATDDAGNESAPATAVIRVLPLTEPSSPDARLRVPPLAQEGGSVTLDGSASTDRDGRIVRYQWSALVRPPGSTALAAPVVTTDPAFTFVADRPGLYLVQLVVVDDTGLVSRPDTAPVVVLRKLPPVRGGR